MRTRLLIVICPLVLAALAGAADVRPVPAGSARRADPAQVAGARLVPGGGWERTTEWMPYGGGGGVASDEPYYASLELEGGEGCDGVGGYLFLDPNGDPLNLPSTLTNMKIADDASGVQATGVDLMWWWTDNGNGNPWYLAVFTAESVSTDCSLPAYAEVYDGVVFEFNPLSTGYWYTSVRGLDAYGLFYQMPADGEGGWILIFDDPDGNPLGPVQEVSYGTSNNGGSPGRPGESTDPTWSDRDDSGDFDESECLSYALGLCPDPLTTGINFWGPEPFNACYADCEQDSDFDFFDFLCFTNDFNEGGDYSDCNGDGAHDLFDFLCYINAFGGSC
jgi:hypothetical protein